MCGFVVMSFKNGAMREAKKFTPENPIKENQKGDFRSVRFSYEAKLLISLRVQAIIICY